MANTEHLEILKQGVGVWNKWRTEHKDALPDFSGADLRNSDLSGANLRDTSLSDADLRGANLSGADLDSADLSEANLRDADLSNANLVVADLSGADLSGADFTDVILAYTTFVDNDLSAVKGLEEAHHETSSGIGIDTIYKSQGNIPEIFLRGCGVPESFIVQTRSLVASTEAIQFYSCFISYSSKDQEFAERLHADLQSKGVRIWFAPHDMKIGARIRPTIDETIRVYDKLLLVLSEHSVSSQWVEQEVETALRKERQSGGTVLFPVRLDDAALMAGEGWPALVKDTRHIGDFTRWKDHDSYQKAFERLLRDLKAEEDNKLKQMTADSLMERAVLSPRNTIKEAWEEVEQAIVEAATSYGLAGDEQYVECGQLINKLHEAGKISVEVRKEYFKLSRIQFNVTSSFLLPVEAGEAISFAKDAEELRKALTVDTPPLP